MLLNENGDVLLAHTAETRHWDIPKGAPDPAENHRGTVLHETREETGLVLDGHALVELGYFPYRHDKELHLFATHLRRIEVTLDTLTCMSMFSSYYGGRLIPETDMYCWTTADEMLQYMSQLFTRLFMQTLTLTGTDARSAEAELQTNSA